MRAGPIIPAVGLALVGIPLVPLQATSFTGVTPRVRGVPVANLILGVPLEANRLKLSAGVVLAIRLVGQVRFR